MSVLIVAVGAAAATPAASASPSAQSTSSTPQTPSELAARAADAVVSRRPTHLHAGAEDAFVRHSTISSAGMHYVPYDRTYRSLPVIGGDFVLVVDRAGQVSSASVAQTRPIHGLDTKPRLTRADAEAIAASQLRSVSETEGSRLVVYALGDAPRLAWESTVEGTGADGVSRLTVAVDAITGAVLDRREGVLHDVGYGGFNGPNPLSVPSIHYTYIEFTVPHVRWLLGDPGIGGLVCNGSSLMRIDPPTTPTWGDGDPTKVETACVDAVYATETEHTMLAQWLGRDGLDGDGHAFPISVGVPELNAHYNYGPFTAGVEIGHDLDGKWLATLDIVGHENGHGIDDHTPGGISRGGTAEFIADAFGAATEWFANQAAPYDTPDFVIGDRTRLFTRSMFAAACFSSATPTMEVHDAAAPGDHWFYLLAEGTNPTDGQPVSPTCNGTTIRGLGISTAMQILYHAMLMKTSASSYPSYRTWTLTAAKNLYPNDCNAFNTVRAAWDAVSVPAQPGDPVCTQPTTVPYVIGLTKAEAIARLTAAGLSAVSVTFLVDSTLDVGIVQSQSKPHGTLVPPGTSVQIGVGVFGANPDL